MKYRLLFILFISLSVASNLSGTAVDLKAGFAIGNPEINSIKAIAFGPENILFVGDNSGMQLFAIDIKDQKIKPGYLPKMERLNEKLAAAMGATKADLTIHDMAVNPATKNVFFAVSREKGEQSHFALFRLDADGLQEVSLQNVSHSKFTIENAPAADHKTWRRPSRTYTVTDLHYANGEIIVSGLSNEEFSSGLRRIPFPFNDKMVTTNVQVYHVSHGRNETHAPIYRFLPVQLEKEWHVVAGYMCTPLVTFPLKDLSGNKKLVGKTVAEIGAGNTPTGIISYTFKGQDYILVGNNVHPLTKITGKDLFHAKALQAPSRDKGVKRQNIKLGSIAHLANFDEANILVMVKNKSTDTYLLKTVPKASI